MSFLQNPINNPNLELLLQHNADVNHQDLDGITPLKIACYMNCKEAIKQLIQAGASLDTPDLLHLAIKGNAKIKYHSLSKALIATTKASSSFQTDFQKTLKLLNKYKYSFTEVDESGIFGACSSV